MALRSINKTATGGAPMAPTLAAPLHVYYDATVQTAANGTSLTSLVDQSGNARDAARTAGTITYNTAGLNGLPAFDFVSGTYATTPTFTAISGATAITMFAVAQFTTTGDRCLLSAATPTFSVDCGMVSAATAWLVNRGSSVTAGTTNTSPHRFRWFLAASNTATSLLTVDGTTVAGPGAAGFGAPTSWRLGANSSGFENFIGKISEVRIYAGNVSGSEVTAMESYLSSKWGI